MTEETLFEFPCQFPIKAFGKSNIQIEMTVLEIINRHVPEESDKQIKTRPSKDGNYLSVTITIEATSKMQLDAIYRDLTEHPAILMAL